MSVSEVDIARFEGKLDGLVSDVDDLKQVVVGLARLEERHVETTTHLQRAFAAIEKNQDAIEAVEKRMISQESEIQKGVEAHGKLNKVAWTIASIVGLMLMAGIGLSI